MCIEFSLPCLCGVCTLCMSVHTLTGVVLIGDGDIRLVNAPNGELCEGRLEIFKSSDFFRAWFTVCANEYDQKSLSVACRELGCPISSPFRRNISRCVFTHSFPQLNTGVE